MRGGGPEPGVVIATAARRRATAGRGARAVDLVVSGARRQGGPVSARIAPERAERRPRPAARAGGAGDRRRRRVDPRGRDGRALRAQPHVRRAAHPGAPAAHRPAARRPPDGASSPEHYIAEYADAGASVFTFHPEATVHVQRQLAAVRERGHAGRPRAQPGHAARAASRRSWPTSTWCWSCRSTRATAASRICRPPPTRSAASARCSTATGRRAALEVDGGITTATIAEAWGAGADTFVAGTAVFGAADPARGGARAAAPLRRAGLRTSCRSNGSSWGSCVAGVARRRHHHDQGRERGRAGARSARRAPDFRAVDLATGDSVSLRERYRGKVTLVNIWATWCVPCRVEMPAMEQLYDCARAARASRSRR